MKTKRRFVISDFHLGHDRIYTFVDSNGNRIRPWAESSIDGDEIMIEAYNSIVRNNDTCYILGDVAIKRAALKKCARLNGRKILIRGNHDIFALKDYLPYFDDVRGTHKYSNLILSHYPIHSGSFPEWCVGNVHGHTHINLVHIPMFEKSCDPGSNNKPIPDNRYWNACVEIVYNPMDLELISNALTKQKNHVYN